MYRRIKAEGRLMRSFPLAMRYARGPGIDESRIGFVVRKRSGHAVQRNTFRRLLRETFRQARPQLSTPAWVVFEVSDQALQSTRAQFRASARALVEALCRESP